MLHFANAVNLQHYKKEFFHFNIVIKICAERRAFFPQLSCLLNRKLFRKKLLRLNGLKANKRTKTHVRNQQCNDNNNDNYY